MYKILGKMLSFSLYLVPFVVLIVIPGTFYPFIFVRTLIFQLFIEILGLIWLVLSIKNHGERGVFKTSALFWSVLAFWAVNLLATIFSVSPGISFFGKAMRMDGFIFLSHLAVWFLLLVAEFKTAKSWKNFFTVSAVLGAIVSLVGLAQYFWNVLPGYIFQTDRVFSFLGNSSFFAGYLIFFIFITLALIAESRGWKAKIFWTAVLLVDLAAFYNARSRGALLGLLFGVAVIFLGMLISKERSKKLKIAGAIIFLFIISSVVSAYFLSRTSLIGYFPALQRFSAITDPANYGTRLIGAEVALDGIKEKPLLGWGPGNYDLIFDKYYRPESLKFSFAETVWDKPHNYLLEMGTSAGLLGIAGFLAIYVCAFLGIRRARKAGSVSGLVAGIFYAFLFAKLIFVVSAFDTPEPLIMFFAFLAYVNFLGQKDAAADMSVDKFRGIKQIVFALVAIALVFCAALNIKNIRTSTSIAKADESLYLDEFVWRDNVLQMLTENSSYKDDMLTFAVVDLTAWEKKDSNINEILQPAIAPIIMALKDAEQRNPNAFIYPFQLAQVYGMRGDYMGDRGAFQLALSELERANKISDQHQSAYLIEGKIYMTMGDSTKAITAIRRAVALYPDAPMSHWFLGLALMQNGQTEEAFQELEKRSYFELTQPEILYMISLYDQRKMYDKIIPIYGWLAQTDPVKAAEWWARLAATYLAKGDKNNASMAAAKALTLDPSLRTEIGNFLKQLEKLK